MKTLKYYFSVINKIVFAKVDIKKKISIAWPNFLNIMGKYLGASLYIVTSVLAKCESYINNVKVPGLLKQTKM